MVSSKSLMSKIEVALGRRELPEVADVRVAARLHADAGDRRGREVDRHHAAAPRKKANGDFAIRA